MAGIISGLSRGSRVGLTVGVLLLLMALGGKYRTMVEQQVKMTLGSMDQR